jgi:hypothetical protein
MSIHKQDWFGLLLVVIVGSVAIAASSQAFLSGYNIQVLLATVAIGTMVALSQAIIIAIGQMNLSIGAIGGLAAIAFAGSMEVWGLPWPLAAGLGLAIGLGSGLLNGWLVARTGISAFVITLATLYIFTGLTMGITEAQPFYGVAGPVKWFGDATLIGPLADAGPAHHRSRRRHGILADPPADWPAHPRRGRQPARGGARRCGRERRRGLGARDLGRPRRPRRDDGGGATPDSANRPSGATGSSPPSRPR